MNAWPLLFLSTLLAVVVLLQAREAPSLTRPRTPNPAPQGATPKEIH